MAATQKREKQPVKSARQAATVGARKRATIIVVGDISYRWFRLSFPLLHLRMRGLCSPVFSIGYGRSSLGNLLKRHGSKKAIR